MTDVAINGIWAQGFKDYEENKTPQFENISLYSQDKTRFQMKRRQKIPTTG